MFVFSHLFCSIFSPVERPDAMSSRTDWERKSSSQGKAAPCVVGIESHHPIILLSIPTGDTPSKGAQALYSISGRLSSRKTLNVSVNSRPSSPMFLEEALCTCQTDLIPPNITFHSYIPLRQSLQYQAVCCPCLGHYRHNLWCHDSVYGKLDVTTVCHAHRHYISLSAWHWYQESSSVQPGK